MYLVDHITEYFLDMFCKPVIVLLTVEQTFIKFLQ
jgi:hypothetical protein